MGDGVVVAARKIKDCTSIQRYKFEKGGKACKLVCTKGASL
jgi:hypothetical protein